MKLLRQTKSSDDIECQAEATKEIASYEELVAAWGEAWDALDEAEQESIRRSIGEAGWHYLFREPFSRMETTPRVIHRLCLQELARRRSSESDAIAT